MHDPAAFAKFVPGFDFLQGLIGQAGNALPGIQQWIAPTVDPEELEKRIRDLRTVQFWLEQNAKLIGTTVQALEVQRMTLATLKTMNLPLADLQAAMKMPEPAAPAPAPTATPAPAPQAATAAAPTAAAKAKAGAAPTGADPMQWWTALTQQFGELAAQTLKDVAPAVGAAATTAKGPAAAAKPSAAAKTPRRQAAVKKAPKRAAAAKRRPA